MKIDSSKLTTYKEHFLKNPQFTISKNAITSGHLKNTILNRDHLQRINEEVFSKKIEIDTNVLDQESSGRCWIFSMLNLFRLKFIKKHGVDATFEFSENYLLFYDKLEKANSFLQKVRENRDKDLNSLEMINLFDEPSSDGGNFTKFSNLITKYGIVPKVVMGETYQSNNTKLLNRIMDDLIKETAYKIFSAKSENEIDILIEERLKEIYSILCIFLGSPPDKFDWEFYSSKKTIKKNKKKGKTRGKKRKKKGGSYKIVKELTPLSFYEKYVPIKSTDFVSLVDSPNHSKNKPLIIKNYNYVIGGHDNCNINVEMDDIVHCLKKSIDDDTAVYFTCDIKKYSSINNNLLDTELFNYKEVLGTDISVDKKIRTKFRISTPHHAMIIKGYNITDGEIKRWLAENTWGYSTGKLSGSLNMSHNWFLEFAYSITVHKKYVRREILNLMKKKPVVINSWETF